MNHIQNSNLIAAAIGVSVGVIGAASIFIYHKILENRQHSTTNVNLESVNKKIAALQAEINAIRQQQSQQKKKRKGVPRRYASNDSTYTATDNDTDIDAFSTVGTDLGDDEFYDCSDSESAAGENDTRTSGAMNYLDLDLNEIDKLDEEVDYEAYCKLKVLVQSQPDNVNLAWRYAKACYRCSLDSTDSNVKMALILEGIEACENLLDSQNADLYKWYAILIGINGEYLPLAEKIKNGNRFKQHVIMALDLRPEDAELHHLLGRFKYEVSSLSWFERKIASTLFSEPPSATYEEALVCFEQSEQLSKEPNVENRLYLGKTYIALNLHHKALDWLDKVLELPSTAEADKILREQATELLDKYSEYRTI